ncbi:hypothetical protein SLEP1_g2666 [Rubroshorea leprosula]|uniref:Ankyrin repeat protein n=1 Tax=Rubroshorea leprosula TaxID=152421 RepID=A0AAV5HRM3_9ROSI|nr:hypothetical protein SLEP1_g2666 [Rubroshorea leprosula]
MTEKPHYVELKNCICKGDWEGVKRFFVLHNYPLNTLIISDAGYTALHVALKVGQDKIAEELLEMMSEADLETKTIRHGGTDLSFVAKLGRTHLAKCIVQKNSRLLTIEDKRGYIPVSRACAVGHKEMTEYLYSVTPPQVLLSQNGIHGYHLIRSGIANKILGT